MDKLDPICKQIPHILHGGDYNPDQWLHMPEILEEDVRLMKLAGINSASVAIFAWRALEPEEGVYNFEWLDRVMDRLYENGISVVLATPSGARPAWMDAQHPEVLRVGADRVRNLHGERHNHCYTSPYYRRKVREMNALLAERYGKHPALTMWHISNEYGGECHCERCQEAFREWLRDRYDGDIEKLNRAWWTSFWSHRYGTFEEIESPSPHGENSVHGLKLDWMRFVTFQTRSFLENETAPLKALTPDIPVVTNLMGTYPGLDPWKLAPSLDAISWDNYPRWHSDERPTWEMAANIAFVHDLNRSLKKKPFLMMESTPSQVNWMPINKLKRPGMHILASMQAVAHGSDSVQYFQWRKGRGASEKFHGAVVDHCGHENTRVFREVAELGRMLRKLDGVVGTNVPAEAAVIYDWENEWAVRDFQGFHQHRDYENVCKEHYRALWKRGVSADVIDMEQDFSGYRLLAAPMLYMLKPGVAARLRTFVENGGDLVLTYLSGYVNETDLCWLGGFPGDGLREVCGIWNEETDALYPSDSNRVCFGENSLGMEGEYRAFEVCEVIHAEGCETLAVYGEDFYAGMPAVTMNRFGKGRCFYIAARTDSALSDTLYERILTSSPVKPVLDTVLPEGVSVTRRCGGTEEYLFLMNFSETTKTVHLPDGFEAADVLEGGSVSGEIILPVYGVRVLRAGVRTDLS